MTTPSNSPYTPDLRGFIEFLEKEHPEHVVRIRKEVDPKFGASFLGVLVIHGWWLPSKGINGWTGEPRDKYYALRGWKQ